MENEKNYAALTAEKKSIYKEADSAKLDAIFAALS